MRVSAMFQARLAGVFYLCVAVTGFFSHFARQKLMVPGDAIMTFNNLRTNSNFFTTSIISDAVMTACWIATAITLYSLFCRNAYRMRGLAMVALVLGGSAVVLANIFPQVAAAKLAGMGNAFAYTIEERQRLALLAMEVSQSGFMVASFFFGLWLYPLAFLVWRSECFPHIVGVILAGLLVIAGFGYLADFFFNFYFPEMKIRLSQSLFWGELILLLWLLLKGARENRLPSETGRD